MPGSSDQGGGSRSGNNHHDPVTRGVVVGNQVVDEWLRQAEQTARLLAGPSSNGGWADTSGRLFRAASDMAAAWLSAVGMFEGGSPTSNESAFSSQNASRHGPAAAPAPTQAPVPSGDVSAPQSSGRRVRLDVTSRKRIEVTVELSRSGVEQFRVLDLRPEHGDAPRIERPRVEKWDADGLCVHVVVPDGQPAGAYHAVILDDVTDCAAGTLSVRIRD